MAAFQLRPWAKQVKPVFGETNLFWPKWDGGQEAHDQWKIFLVSCSWTMCCGPQNCKFESWCQPQPYIAPFPRVIPIFWRRTEAVRRFFTLSPPKRHSYSISIRKHLCLQESSLLLHQNRIRLHLCCRLQCRRASPITEAHRAFSFHVGARGYSSGNLRMPALYTSAKEGKQVINRQSPRDFSLVIADKILARVLLNRPIQHLEDGHLPQNQCVFCMALKLLTWCLLHGMPRQEKC